MGQCMLGVQRLLEIQQKPEKKTGYHQFTESFQNRAKKLEHNFSMQIQVTKGFWQGIILSVLAAP